MIDARWNALLEQADAQTGLVTRRQVAAAGISNGRWDHLVSTTPIPQIARGLYQLRAPLQGELREHHAAVLLCGKDAVISHRAAARLYGWWGVDGFPLEVTAQRRLTLDLPSIVVHHGKVEKEDLCDFGELLVTSRERTLLDLAPILDRMSLACMLESARRKWRGVIDSVAAQMELANLPDDVERAFSVLLADCDARPTPMDSPFEVQFWHRWPYTGLPMPVTQHEVWDDQGRMFLDFAWVDEKVVVETMGYGTRRTQEAHDNENARTDRLVAMGYLVIPVTYATFRDNFYDGVTAAVGKALADRRVRGTSRTAPAPPSAATPPPPAAPPPGR